MRNALITALVGVALAVTMPARGHVLEGTVQLNVDEEVPDPVVPPTANPGEPPLSR